MKTRLTMTSLLVAMNATPAFSASLQAQLVQSIPQETSLAQPDLPFAKDAWIKLIRETKSTLEMGEFYLSSAPGSPLVPVIEELEKAGNRGVKIRLLLCPKMVSQDPDTFARVKAIHGIEVRMLDLGSLHGILHAKYFVSDQKTIFVGSQNFDWRALTQIHETGIVLKDPKIASQLERIFEADWKFAGGSGSVPSSTTETAAEESTVELVASPPAINPPGIAAALPELVKLIASAKTSIRATVMSYGLTDKYGAKTPGQPEKWTEIDDALRAAAARGVHVEFMVSDWSVADPAIDELKSLGRVPGIEVRIVSIPESKSGHIPYARVTHSKFMVVDGKTLWLGTSNWERNYFYGSRNVELILRDPSLAKKGEKIYSKLWKSPYAEKVDQARHYTPRKQG